jgi:hypothetical protein
VSSSCQFVIRPHRYLFSCAESLSRGCRFIIFSHSPFLLC